MSVKIVSSTGSGRIVENSIISYSYSEDAVSLDPSDLSGGAGQLTLVAIEREEDIDGEYLPNTKLMINNTITLSDSDRGQIELQVKSVSTNAGAVTITGDTIMSRLNVEKTAQPFYYIPGDPVFTGTLEGAIKYYAGLCGVYAGIKKELQDEATAMQVNFIGWTGNVWEHLKMLCSGVSLLEDDNFSMTMYISAGALTFRKANFPLNSLYNKFENKSYDVSESVDAFQAAKTIEVYNYNTSAGVDRIIYEISNYAEDADPNTTFLASISDSMQVEAGQTITKTFEIDASLTSVNNPVCVSTIDPYPYTGTTGQYVIVGNDDLPVLPSQWVEMGGNITVAVSDTPNSIDITITAPVDDGILLADGSKVSYGPYRIGVESSGDGVEYPAFFITGTGVFYNKKKHIFHTGSDNTITTKDAAPIVDNIFISTASHLANRGVIAAQSACGPKINISAGLGDSAYQMYGLNDGLNFGSLPGSIFKKGSNIYRVTSASYSSDALTVSGSSSVGFEQFNNNWTGETFADFDAIALPGVDELAFNEFTVVPLIKE